MGDPTEVDQLRAWKESAMAELARWDAVFEALGRPGRLGLAKAESCAALIERSLVIPRDAIPDGLVEFLDGWAEEIEDQPYAPMSASEMEDARRLRTAARLLSGGAS